MARKRNSVSDEELNALKAAIQARIDFKIRLSKDCNKLAELISKVTKSYVSASTIRRIWAFESTTFAPSYSTIEILQEFIAIKDQSQKLSYMAQFVIDFYHPMHFETIDPDDKTFQASCRKIVLLLNEQPNVFAEVKEILAQSELGRRFFYELFPDYDWLMNGLLDGYHSYLQFSTSRNDRLFGLSMFFYHAYLTQNKALMMHYAAEIREIWERESGDVHPFVLGRCFFAFLYTAKEEDWSNILRVMWKEEQMVPRCERGLFREFPGFHYFVCDALYQRGDFSSLYEMTTIAMTKFPKTEEFEWKGYYEQIKVYQAAALWILKKDSEALRLFNSVNTTNYYFISRDYYLSVYHSVRQLLEVD